MKLLLNDKEIIHFLLKFVDYKKDLEDVKLGSRHLEEAISWSLDRKKKLHKFKDKIKEKIEMLLQRDFFLDEIINIKEIEYSGPVYDLLVPETNNFICEGIVVHNCIDEIEKMTEQERERRQRL